MIHRPCGFSLMHGEEIRAQTRTIVRNLNIKGVVIRKGSHLTARLVLVGEFDGVGEQIREVGITTIIVEQNALAVLKCSDRAVILDTGVVVYDGPAQEVLEYDDLRNRYLAI